MKRLYRHFDRREKSQINIFNNFRQTLKILVLFLNNRDTYNEVQLIELLKANDESAFTELYQNYAMQLYSRIQSIVKSEHHSQEILQDVFLKIWEVRHRLDSRKYFRAYIFKITENRIYDFFRELAKDKALKTDWKNAIMPTVSELELTTSDISKEELLQQAIETLPPQRQKVFTLCKLEGKSYKEVSEELGLSVSTVSDHIVKGTKAVRQYILNKPEISAGMLILIVSLFT